MRRSAIAAAAALVALAAPAAAAAMQGMDHGTHATHGMGAMPATDVAQLFATYSPAGVDVVTGDMVRWTNDSVRAHTTTADDGSFDSGRMASGEVFERHFASEGVVAYHCSLHATMRGQVRVHDVLLERPAAGASPGRPFPLAGRTALAEGSPVTIEADTGAGFVRAATTTVGAGGAFTASVVPRASGSYRAVVGDRASASVPLVVLDRRVTATTSRRRGRLTVSVKVTPAAPGAHVVLQLHLPRRFGWWPVQRGRLGRDSRATLRTPLRRARPARVLLTLPDGATTLASSGPLKVS